MYDFTSVENVAAATGEKNIYGEISAFQWEKVKNH